MTNETLINVAELTDSQLNKYLTNFSTYSVEILETVVTELRKRGRNISDEEYLTMLNIVKQRGTSYNTNTTVKIGTWDPNAVDDSEAPELYSKRAIFGFAVLGAPIFSAILFSMNLNKLGKQKSSTYPLLFGILWLVLFPIMAPQMGGTSFLYLWNAAGALIIQYIFWPMLVGADQKYRKRSVLFPSIINGFLIAIIVLITIYGR